MERKQTGIRSKLITILLVAASVEYASSRSAMSADKLQGDGVVTTREGSDSKKRPAAKLNNAIIKVESIEPDPVANLQEIDDGDGNPKTRVFVVPYSSEHMPRPITVRATISPSLPESELPLGFGLTGGDGAALLTRSIDRGAASKTVFTFWCGAGSSDSGFKTTVYVYYASVSLFADGQLDPVGHSWGEYNLDYDTRRDLIDPVFWACLNQEMGFFPTNTASWATISLGDSVPGDVRLGAAAHGSHSPTADKEYPILFGGLWDALPLVEALSSSPPQYNLFSYNCTDFAIGLGGFVSVNTMDASGVSTPLAFANWLNAH